MKKFFIQFAIFVCALFLGSETLWAKGDKSADTQTVYIFGVATAFGDSIMHFTEIQEIQGIGLVKKGFLEGRSLYSYQLKGYLENAENLPNRTCTVFFSEKKSKLQKKYTKLKQRYQANKKLSCRTLDATTFSFEKYEAEY
ncbi:MAG: hypothetical protein IJ013_04620 [Bacteroidaceae bacterium]|nr:hypothetical protein [Bacteroidaceae bacterium]